MSRMYKPRVHVHLNEVAAGAAGIEADSAWVFTLAAAAAAAAAAAFLKSSANTYTDGANDADDYMYSYGQMTKMWM